MNIENNKIKFYILVPVYNVEKYINRAFDSIISQTYINYQVIIVDDGSTDNSSKICDEYTSKYSNFYVIHKKNEGLMSARRVAINYVLENCEIDDNTYFVFSDSDDTLKPNLLEKINETLLSNRTDMVIYEYDRTLNGKIISHHRPHVKFDGLVKDKLTMYKILVSEVYSGMWQKASKASLFTKDDYSRYYHISYGEDTVQSCELFKNANSLQIISDHLYNYEINEDSMMGDKDPNKFFYTDARKYVWNYLNNVCKLSDNELSEIRPYQMYIFAMTLRAISYRCKDYNEFHTMMNELRNDGFYSIFINKNSKIKSLNIIDDILLTFYIKGLDMLLFLIYRMVAYAIKR